MSHHARLSTRQRTKAAAAKEGLALVLLDTRVALLMSWGALSRKLGRPVLNSLLLLTDWLASLSISLYTQGHWIVLPASPTLSLLIVQRLQSHIHTRSDHTR